MKKIAQTVTDALSQTLLLRRNVQRCSMRLHINICGGGFIAVAQGLGMAVRPRVSVLALQIRLRNGDRRAFKRRLYFPARRLRQRMNTEPGHAC